MLGNYKKVAAVKFERNKYLYSDEIWSQTWILDGYFHNVKAFSSIGILYGLVAGATSLNVRSDLSQWPGRLSRFCSLCYSPRSRISWHAGHITNTTSFLEFRRSRKDLSFQDEYFQSTMQQTADGAHIKLVLPPAIQSTPTKGAICPIAC